MHSLEPQSRSSGKTAEKALLVGLFQDRREESDREHTLEELRLLALSAGAEASLRVLTEVRELHAATLIGRGKVERLAMEVKKQGVNIVIFDEDLTPTQNRNLEEMFGCKVIDRTGLILDIFAKRARSREGKIQVELAQLKYLLPRLSGHGHELSRLGGGIGTRGPGETELEMDQRRVRSKIGSLTSDLARLRAHREIHRRKREGVGVATVSIVGYTNAGKSTLMNRLTGAGVPVADQLFMTLDPTVRRLRLPSGREILLADTVGFVRKLPHQLIEAFYATFEEVGAADLLLHVIDSSRPGVTERIRVVEGVLAELDLSDRPVLRVFNKADQGLGQRPEGLDPMDGDQLISALQGEGLEGLLAEVDLRLAASFQRVSFMIPHADGSVLSQLYSSSRVVERTDCREGVLLQAEVSEKYFNKFKKFRTLPR
ncbi:MAG: GTPase HflX [Deltaproteobacteria bacterium]|nr:GTPase HflX [Deltaproteobacteria bacterium]